ncbi:MAG: FAD-dependent oxidoreductase [Sphingomonadaceae bacterium]
MQIAERPVHLETDVLVIGGAAAGLTAAIDAAEAGASVLVACKGKAGRSGNTVVAGTQFAAVIPYPGSEDSPESHFQDTLAGGRGINDETLLRLFTTRGGPLLLRAEEWGVRLLRSEGELVRRTPPGHSYPRGIPTDGSAFAVSAAGLSIGLPLRARAERLGVRFLENAPVLRVEVSDGEACGALAVDLDSAQPIQVRARAVVVAAGGAGRVFAHTNNTRGISGDSYGLLLLAGVTLRDMEFVQFYPSQMNNPFKTVIASPLFADGAVLRNRHGERFMPIYDPVHEDLATRDVMCQAIFYELQKGNGIQGEVYMDCTSVPESVLQTKYGPLVRDLRRQGVDPARDWLLVTATTHFVMGGAWVDERCSTDVPGLFAAGEAVGGLHGANRLSGNALMETIVTGAIAGKAAAEYARRRGRLPEPRVPTMAPEPVNGDGGMLEAARTELRRAMWNGASIVRSETSLRSALGMVRECLAAVEAAPAKTMAELARREETRLMALTAEAMVLSALERRESRGAHFREDFPSTDARWLGSIATRLSPGGLEVEFRPKGSGSVMGDE